MVGRPAGLDRKYYHFVAPSCKLKLARFSTKLRIQDGAECGDKLAKIYELDEVHSQTHY